MQFSIAYHLLFLGDSVIFYLRRTFCFLILWSFQKVLSMSHTHTLCFAYSVTSFLPAWMGSGW